MIHLFCGVILGFITTGLLFPKILDAKEIGLLSILVSYSVIISQIASLGFRNVTTKFFPYFRDYNNKHNGFLFLSLFITLVGFILATIAFFIIKPYIVSKGIEKSPLLAKYINYCIPLIFSYLFFFILDNYYKVLYNATTGFFLKEVLQRFLILVFIIFVYFNLFNFSTFVLLYVLAFCLPLFLLVYVLIRKKQFNLKPKLRYISKDRAKSMVSVGFFGIATTTTGIIVLNIDRIMIEKYLTLAATGIYTIAYFFGSLIRLPAKSVSKISSVFIADAWKNNDKNKIQEIYSESTINQMIIGALLLIGIWANIHNILAILPDSYSLGRYVILFIGLSCFLDMLAGTSKAILANSPSYKMNGYFMLLFLSMIILTNILFIPLLGITGAALASLLSNLIFHITKWLFLSYKYHLQPYVWKHFFILIIAVISYLISRLIQPNQFALIPDIIIRSLLITFVFMLSIYFGKISERLNKKIDYYFSFFCF
jgi:O-antigen/teichoic acid export membrane protein